MIITWMIWGWFSRSAFGVMIVMIIMIISRFRFRCTGWLWFTWWLWFCTWSYFCMEIVVVMVMIMMIVPTMVMFIVIWYTRWKWKIFFAFFRQFIVFQMTNTTTNKIYFFSTENASMFTSQCTQRETTIMHSSCSNCAQWNIIFIHELTFCHILFNSIHHFFRIKFVFHVWPTDAIINNHRSRPKIQNKL